MFYSIIIPVYNEEKRIPQHIDEIFSFFNTKSDIRTEIIFVNDGSHDRTKEVLEKYRSSYQFTFIDYQENKGKGFAIKQGVLKAQGDWVVFFDIDLATPLIEFDNLRTFMDADDEVIIGSRRLETSEIKKKESKLRTFLGHGFTKLSNILVPGIKDFTCGFKCFRRDVAQLIFSKARIDRWGFDTELLYIARLQHKRIRQMPVTWAHDTDSKVKVFKAVLSSLSELVQMKWNQVKGLYK